MSSHLPTPAQPEASHGSLRMYVTGFMSSVVLTLLAYALVVNHLFSTRAVLACIAVLAVVQFFVQLVFFLHVGKESKPRWNITALLFMLLVVVIVVFGSLWIMNNLNYNGMTPTQTDQFIEKDEGL